jgi:mannan endo-1,4-beta-mannosidase
MGEISAYLKSIDPHHLVTTGIEGYYSGSYAARNTDAWMSDNGQDFITNHQHAAIDFATIHVWPQNWGWDPIGNTSYARSRATLYVQRHIDDANTILGKPLLIEEFGIPRDNNGRGINGGPTTIRDGFFTGFAQQCAASAETGGACAGMTVWILFDDASAGWDDGNGVFFPWDAATDAVLTVNAAVMGRMRRADLDFDLDVDQSDFGLFQVCLTGAGKVVTTPACHNADLEGDGDVDENDLMLFKRCLSGADEVSSINCVY